MRERYLGADRARWDAATSHSKGQQRLKDAQLHQSSLVCQGTLLLLLLLHVHST